MESYCYGNFCFFQCRDDNSDCRHPLLGIGDVSPSEHLRIISGLEGLNGLVLIGWSTSFTFLTMRRFWTEV